MSQNKALNDRRIQKLEKPKKRQVIPDSGRGSIPGMSLRVYTSGNKAFYYRYRWNDQIIDYKIGTYPSVSLGDARAIATDLRNQVSQGINPAAKKREKKRELKKMTVRDLAREFIDDYLPKKKESTQKTYLCRINQIVQKFGNEPLDDLSGWEIKHWLKQRAKKHPTTANRIHSIFSKMYSYANEPEQGFTTVHPLKGMNKVSTEKQRDPRYSHDDIREIWKAFEDQREPLQSLLKILLLTGQRLGETSKMKWVHIDSFNAVWQIPKEDTKGGRVHTVPLSPMAIEVLENIHQLTGKDEYVFSSPIRENNHLSHFNGATKRIREFTGRSDFIIHDLRHIVITEMIALEIGRAHV